MYLAVLMKHPPLDVQDSYYNSFDCDTTIFVEVYFVKYTEPKNNIFPKIENAIVCEANCVDPKIYKDDVSCSLVYSSEDTYRFKIDFSIKGYVSLRFRYKGLLMFTHSQITISHIKKLLEI